MRRNASVALNCKSRKSAAAVGRPFARAFKRSCCILSGHPILAMLPCGDLRRRGSPHVRSAYIEGSPVLPLLPCVVTIATPGAAHQLAPDTRCAARAMTALSKETLAIFSYCALQGSVLICRKADATTDQILTSKQCDYGSAILVGRSLLSADLKGSMRNGSETIRSFKSLPIAGAGTGRYAHDSRQEAVECHDYVVAYDGRV